MVNKYRLWNPQRKHFAYPTLCFVVNDVILTTDNLHGDLIGHGQVSKDISIEQYTNKNDIHGKEMFVGDIVRFKSLMGMEYGEIRFVGTSFCLHKHNELGGYDHPLDQKFKYSDMGSYDEWDGQYEVVGNIHENAELLKESR